MKEIQIIISRSEIGAGTRGASLGPEALQIASYKAGSDYFNNYIPFEIPNSNNLLAAGLKTNKAKNIEGQPLVYEHMTSALKTSLKNNMFPIVLAGDHSSAAATIAGLKLNNPKKRLGVIWVDAHADLHSPYTTPSGNVHGMPLALSLGEDNLNHGHRDDIDKDLLAVWERLKNWGNISPKIQTEDLVFIALRDTEKEEDAIIDRSGIKTYRMEEIDKKGEQFISESVLSDLSHCDLIYISFDVDSMDSEKVSNGTGTPVPNGLLESQANSILNYLLESKKICCLEICEINPTLDTQGNSMAEAAFRILTECTRTIENRLS